MIYYIKHLNGILKKDMFDENFLMSIATLGAIAIGDYTEGIAVLIFYKIGEFLQDLAVKRSKKSIEKVLDIRSNVANLKVLNEVKVVDPKDVKIGDYIIVKTGEKIPLDGIVEEGKTNLDMSMLNGESIPKSVEIGQEVLSGSINLGSVITVKVTKKFEDSTVSQIIDLLENAVNKKSKTENFITRFAKVYTPIVVLTSVIIAIVSILFFNIEVLESIHRALIFLVISCPCALVVSVPLGFFVGIGKASKLGILVKGSNYLDILSTVNTVVFDKTGTLTKGNFEVNKIVVNSELNEEELLENIALCESLSNHYIAKAILKRYNSTVDKTRIKEHEEITGHGIRAIVDNRECIVGNDKMLSKYNIEFEVAKDYGTIIYLAVENEYKGYIVLADEIKEDSKDCIAGLKKSGIKNNIMLTGDSKIIAENISKELGIDKVYGELLPTDKARILEEIKKEDREVRIAYVGDGINDAPVIAMADVGISMGKGSDIAIETSDIVLMTDEASKIVDAIKIAKKTKRIVIQNIVFALAIKVLFLFLSAIGISTMWEAVFADVGVTLIAVINSLRIFR